MPDKAVARKTRKRPAASRPVITLRRNGTTKHWQAETYSAQIGTGMRAKFGNGESPAEALGKLLLAHPRLIAGKLVKKL